MSRYGEIHEDEVLGKAYDGRLMARLWGYTRPYRGWLAITGIIFPVVAAVELAQPYLLKVGIDDYILKGDWFGLWRVAGLFLLLLSVQYALRYWEEYLLNLTGQRVMYDLRQACFAHVQRLSARFFDRTPVGRLMTRILNDVEAVSEMFASGIVSIVGDMVTLTGVVLIMVSMNWRLALVTLSVVPLLFGVATFFRLKGRDAYRAVRIRIARLNAYLQENLQGMRVVQLFGKERAHWEEFRRINADYRRALFGRMTYDALLYAVVETIGSIALALLLWFGGRLILQEALTFGVLVAFIGYTHRFFLPIRDLSAKYTVMQAAMASAERIFSLLDTPPEIVSPPESRRPQRIVGEVEFRDVWFAYEGEDWVLRGVSFRIAPGERVALVGATGAGKSTIARLLNRSYDVSRGQILLDGVDIREWELRTLRQAVGLVLQDVVLFSGTIEENLTLGRDAAHEEIHQALRMANAEGFVLGLPGGLREPVQERGANFSQGQRQLLSIARALIYDPAVLVLDEATSSVDPESEALIREAMEHLLERRTSLIIAHRLSTVHGADRILVLHKGQIREEGTHSALLVQGGLYARLYELQFGDEAVEPMGR